MSSRATKPSSRRRLPRVGAEPHMGFQPEPPHPPVPPKTTLQEDLTTAGQRRVNLIWEFTQAAIALLVVFANMGTAVFNTVQGKPGEVPMILSSALFLVVGFYFSRTNHQAIGGTGMKPVQPPYQGR